METATEMHRRPEQTNSPRREGKVFFHTLCTCSADASKIERGYAIGLRRRFSLGHRLHLRSRPLSACSGIEDKAISAKYLRALGCVYLPTAG